MTGTVAERAATGLAMGVQSARRRTRDDDALERRSVRRHGFNRGFALHLSIDVMRLQCLPQAACAAPQLRPS